MTIAEDLIKKVAKKKLQTTQPNSTTHDEYETNHPILSLPGIQKKLQQILEYIEF